MADSLKHYLATIQKELADGNATEHTHRTALKTLFEVIGGTDITATNEPKRVQCGAPDFVITKDTKQGPLTIGYIETKDVDTKAKTGSKILDDAEDSEQLKRYRRSLGNLILTDYLEFRWYVDGEQRSTARLARADKAGKLISDKDGEETVPELLREFLSHTPESISTPKELAQRMARLTHIIRDIIVEAFEKEEASDLLRDLRKAFATALIPDLDQPGKTGEFADMYAQTIAYGLFAARCNHRGPKRFRRLGAAAEIPKTNPFLRTLFETITGTALDDEPYAGFVDDLAQLLDYANMAAVLEHFGKRTRREDPVVHFYETFLATYDPKLREARGVYYTPEPVVSYIVRSVDYLLRARFNLEGLADTSVIEYEWEEEDKSQKHKGASPRVLILDPACGTGTFLYAVVDLIREPFMKQHNAGMWSGYVKQHLLPRLFGFELLMAPYAVAHFKLGMQLAGQDLTEAQRELWAYDFSGDERLGIYLTNTLEEVERKAETLFGPLRVITEEAHAAARVKRNLPILIIMGNPPYSANSANKQPWIMELVRQEYYPKDLIKEHNPKLLLDDYVKFTRWAQWRIDHTGAGILAFISNHGYLDNPTFRRMRQALMDDFTDIYILDLHGNAKRKERAPDGSKDENVFDIQQGVTIGIFVKAPDTKGSAKVYHSALWGLRKHKYSCLSETSVDTTPWTQLDPQAPFYLFVPQDTEYLSEYKEGSRINDTFPVHSTGIKTHRDHFVLDFDRDALHGRLKEFRDLSIDDGVIRERYRLPDTRDWKLSERRRSLAEETGWERHFIKCLYRSFDFRPVYFHSDVIELPRPEVMGHMRVGKNFGLCTNRQVNGDFRHALCTKEVVTDCTVSPATRERTYLFPLYLYHAVEQGRAETQQEWLLDTSPWPPGKEGRVPNLNPAFVAELGKRLGLKFVSDGTGDLKNTFGPEDILHYIYAVFHSPTYRERYAEFLKIDFPRVPLTSDRELFRVLCALGRELVALHLLESPTLSKLITSYPVPGDHRVEKGHPKYLAPGEPEPGTGEPLEQGRVYINQRQYFDGLPPEVWEFHVGGYQVCHKWLKDRQGRTLSYGDLSHYQKIIVALKETRRLMGEIDEAIPSWPIR